MNNKPQIVSEELSKEIIEFYENNNNNTIPVIMKKFDLKESTAHRVINKYFKQKFNKFNTDEK